MTDFWRRSRRRRHLRREPRGHHREERQQLYRQEVLRWHRRWHRRRHRRRCRRRRRRKRRKGRRCQTQKRRQSIVTMTQMCCQFIFSFCLLTFLNLDVFIIALGQAGLALSTNFFEAAWNRTHEFYFDQQNSTTELIHRCQCYKTFFRRKS